MAVLGLVLTAAAIWDEVKVSAEKSYILFIEFATHPGFLICIALLICIYIAAIIYTGGKARQEPGFVLSPQFDDEVPVNQPHPKDSLAVPEKKSSTYDMVKLTEGLERVFKNMSDSSYDPVRTGLPPGLATYKSGPLQPDIHLSGFLGRIYKSLGGAPEDGSAKKLFYKKVDREIADKVSLNAMSVWGYYSDRPIQKIRKQAWDMGRFSHRNKSLSVQGDAPQPMVFRDLKFNKSEVDLIWPPTKE